MIGAYIHKYDVRFSKKKSLIIYIICVCLLPFSRVILGKMALLFGENSVFDVLSSTFY